MIEPVSMSNNIQKKKVEDLLEAIRVEFAQVSQDAASHRLQHQKDYDYKINQQQTELQQIRATVYNLEMAHRKLKDHYDEEVEQLKVAAEQKDLIINDLTIQLQTQAEKQQHQTLLIPPVVPQKPEESAVVVAPTITVASNPESSITNGSLPQPVITTTNETYRVPSNERASNSKPIPPFLLDLDPAKCSPDYKKVETEYYVLYNKALPKTIDAELHKSLDHSSVVCCVQFSNDGKYLATGCNKTTQVYDVATGVLTARLTDDSAKSGQSTNDSNSTDLYIRSVCFSPDGKFLATGAEDKLIRIWDIERQEVVTVLEGHEQDIYSLAYFPRGDKLVSGSGDRTVRVWDLSTGKCSLTLTLEDGVTTVAVSPIDGKYIAAGSLDHSVRVSDSQTGFLIERLDSENEHGNGHRDSVYSVAFTRDGNGIVSGSLDKTVKLWDLQNINKSVGDKKSGTCLATYIGHKDFVLSVTTTKSDKYILSGSKDRGVIFWDSETTDPLLMLQGHKNSVISVSVASNSVFGEDTHVFATGSGDCKARIWKLTKQKPRIETL